MATRPDRGQPALFDPEPSRGKSRHALRGANTRRLEATVRVMRETGLLEECDQASVELARSSAMLLDAALADPMESRHTIGLLMGRHQEALAALRQLREGGGGDGDVSGILRELFAPDGHAPDA